MGKKFIIVLLKPNVSSQVDNYLTNPCYEIRGTFKNPCYEEVRSKKKKLFIFLEKCLFIHQYFFPFIFSVIFGIYLTRLEE